MDFLKFLALITLIAGCKNRQVLIDNLRITNNRYYYKEQGLAFTGLAISKFTTGRTSNEITFKNGIPSGKWVSYGYSGEYVQSGTYKSINLRSMTIEQLTDIKRINLCSVNEGNKTFIILYIITNKSELEIHKGNNSVYKALIDTLKSNNIKIDTSLIDKMYCAKGELSQ